MGIWIVNIKCITNLFFLFILAEKKLDNINVIIKGLEESVEKGILVEENDYEASGSNKLPKSGGPFQGRINVSGQVIFSNLSFWSNKLILTNIIL